MPPNDIPNISDLLADRLTEHQIDLLRVAAHTNREVAALLEGLQREIVGKLANSELSEAKARRLTKLLAEVKAEIRSVYAEIARTHTADLFALASTETRVVRSIVKATIGIDVKLNLAPLGVLRKLTDDTLIQGAPSAEWWGRHAGDLQHRFGVQMRLGIAGGETNGDLVKRVIGDGKLSGLVDGSKRNAAALVRTSVQTVANSARLATFRANADTINGVQQLSTLDERTTEVCIAYSGASWDLHEKPINGTRLPFAGGPPRHWGCRSVLVPITKTWRELGIPLDEIAPGTRASMDGQVAATTTFDEWLRGRSETSQNKILGKGKAGLWRDGKISLTDLLDQSGRPMTLTQLLAKH